MFQYHFQNSFCTPQSPTSFVHTPFLGLVFQRRNVHALHAEGVEELPSRCQALDGWCQSCLEVQAPYAFERCKVVIRTTKKLADYEKDVTIGIYMFRNCTVIFYITAVHCTCVPNVPGTYCTCAPKKLYICT